MRAQSKDERPLPVRIVQFSIVSPSAAQADPSLSQQGSDSPQKVSLHIVLFPTESFPLAKAFWQHTGDGISSRMAERCLRLLEEAGSLDSPTGIATPTAATEPATVADETSPDPPRQLESHRSYSRNHHYKSRYAAQPPSAALGPTVSPVTHSFPYEGVPTNNPPTPAAPSAPAAINATLEEDPLTADHATYVEERYGRNLPIASSSLAKRALRRRIAGTLLADRQEGSSEAAETGAEVAETTRSGTGVTEEEVYLFPSGMSAIFHAHQVAMLARVQQLAGQADGVEGGSAALTRGVGKSVCFG